MTTRKALKNYFLPGAIPKASEFADLIDNVLVKEEDNLLQSSNGTLGIKATTDDSLLNFYQTAQNQPPQLAWQLKLRQQQEGGQEQIGLSINSADGKTSRLFIASTTGNIGIGTTTPGDNKLTVAGNTNMTGNLTVNGTTTLNSMLTVKGAATSTTLEGPLMVAGLLTANKGAAIIGGADVDKLTILAGGTLSVGTASPAPGGKLDVQGSVYIGTGEDGKNYKLVLRGPEKTIHLDSHQDLSYEFSGWGSAKIRAYKGGGGDTYLQFLTNDYNSVPDNPQVRLHISDKGNVGIGTTDPGAYKLNVAGDTNVSGVLQTTSGVKFGNGTVQTTGVRVVAGTVNIGGSGSSNVALTGFGQSVPTVIASLSAVQATLTNRGNNFSFSDIDLGINITVSNISPTSFSISTNSSGDTRISSVTVNWLAFVS